MLITNARSLSPKIESLQNNFETHELDFALVTESWLNDGETLNKDVIDLEHGTGLKILYKNRPRRAAGVRRVGGGVSIIFNKNRCNLRERKISGNNFELVAASGRVGKLARQVVIFCVYITPQMRVADQNELYDVINSEILSLKSSADPLIFIGGDLNHRDLDEAVGDFPDIKRVNFEPTRGPACLDVLYSNAAIIKDRVWPPLQSMEGNRSDHSCVVFNVEERGSLPFTWVKKTARKHSKAAVAAFGRRLRETDWNRVLPPGLPTDDAVKSFEDHITRITDELFPLKTTRRRSNDDPWISDAVRMLSRRKKRIFKREGKSPLWCRIRDALLAKIEHNKSAYVDSVEKTGSSTRAYHTAIKSLSCKDKPPAWDIMDLFPGKSCMEAGDEAASFFTKISDEFDPLTPSMSQTAKRRPISQQEVLAALKKAKKPQSSVEGDVLPRIMKAHYHLMIVPITRIFNSVFRTGEWPARWKEETTVIIPKIPNPESLSDCRNISCTAFLSKVLESILRKKGWFGLWREV